MASNVTSVKRALPDNDKVTRTSSAAPTVGKDGNSQNVGSKKDSSKDQRALTASVEAGNDKAAQPSIPKAKKPKKKPSEKLDVDTLNNVGPKDSTALKPCSLPRRWCNLSAHVGPSFTK